MLACSLIKRMRLDLTSTTKDDDIVIDAETEGDDITTTSDFSRRRWVAHSRTLRLSTRPRPPLNLDGTRSRTFTRISKSGPMPSFIFNLTIDVESLAGKLLEETLIPLFHKLHPEKAGWDLSLVNICATNMALTASDGKNGTGRDIGRMFRRQEDVLRDWKVQDIDMAPSQSDRQIGKPTIANVPKDTILHVCADGPNQRDKAEEILPVVAFPDSDFGCEDLRAFTKESNNEDDAWDIGDGYADSGNVCKVCGAIMPSFAMIAHERFHSLPD